MWLRTHIGTAVLGAIVFGPVTAYAQPNWDVSGGIGLFAGHTPTQDDRPYADEWFHTVQASLVVGAYLTPHVKLEVDASLTGSGHWFEERLVHLPGNPAPYPIFAEVEASVRSIGTSLVWQFRNNEWVHPFVRAGVAAEFDRREVHVWEQIYYPRDPREGALPTPVVQPGVRVSTVSRARAVLGGGAKFYMTQRAFVRTEGLATFDDERQNVAFRIGAGIDF